MTVKKWLVGVVGVTVGIMLFTSAAWADKEEVLKKALDTKVTLSFTNTPVTEALDAIATASSITIKKTDIPEDAPKVTVELSDISVLQGVRLVTRTAGLRYAIVDDGIEVSGEKKTSEEKPATDVVPEVKAPEAVAPEAAVPEVKAPEAAAPEVKAAE